MRTKKCPICQKSGQNDCRLVDESWECYHFGQIGATKPGWQCVALADDGFRWLWVSVVSKEPEEPQDASSFVTSTYSDSPAIEPLLEGLLWPGAATLMVGPQRTFKTNLAISIAVTVARGGIWYGYLAIQTKVLYIDSDQTRGWTEAMLNRYWPEWADSGQIYLLNREKLPPDGLRLPRDFKLLQAIIKQQEIGLVVVDTVRSTRELGADESDNRSTLQFMQALKEACGEASVLLLHHTGWAGRRASGSNALASQAHAEIVLNRIEEKDTRRQLLRLTMPTNRYGTELTLFFLIPEPTGDGLPARPLVLFEGRIGAYRVLRDTYGDDQAAEGASSRGKAREVYDYLDKHPNSSGDQVAEGLNMKPNQVREYLSRLRERGEIVQSRITPRPVLWCCATAEMQQENISVALLHSSQGADSRSATLEQQLHNSCTPETQSESAVQQRNTTTSPDKKSVAQQSGAEDNSQIEVGDSVCVLGSATDDAELLRPVWTVEKILAGCLKLKFGDKSRTVPAEWVRLLSKGVAA
jgi:AAA domain